MKYFTKAEIKRLKKKGLYACKFGCCHNKKDKCSCECHNKRVKEAGKMKSKQQRKDKVVKIICPICKNTFLTEFPAILNHKQMDKLAENYVCNNCISNIVLVNNKIKQIDEVGK